MTSKYHFLVRHTLNQPLKTESDSETSKNHKDESYFNALRAQLNEQRDRKIYQHDPSIFEQNHRRYSHQSRGSQHLRTLKSLTHHRTSSLPGAYRNHWDLYVPEKELKHTPSRFSKSKHKTLRSSSCKCPDCGTNPKKLLLSECIPNQFTCKMHQKKAIRRRFRKYVRGVMIVLAYKRNIKTIHSKRIKRLSLKQQALLSIQNPTPQEKIQQARIINQAEKLSSSSSDNEQNKRPPLKKQFKSDIYFKKNYQNSHTVNQFLIHAKRDSVNNSHHQTLVPLDIVDKQLKKKTKVHLPTLRAETHTEPAKKSTAYSIDRGNHLRQMSKQSRRNQNTASFSDFGKVSVERTTTKTFFRK